MPTPPSCWDAVVIGGGPSGCLSAAALAGSGHRVLLADTDRVGRRRIVEVLAPDVVRHLCRLVSWDAVPSAVATRCRGVVTRWGTDEPRVTDYELIACGPAWIVVRPEFDRLLMEGAAAAGAVLHHGWCCVSVEPHRHGLEVSFATETGCRSAIARSVVYATGRSSVWPTGRRAYYDRQIAYVGTFDGPAAVGSLLWVESTPSGWCYANAVPGGKVQLVWVTETRPASGGAEGRATALSRAFAATEMIRSMLGREPVFDATFVCDARLSKLAGPSANGIFSVGDALATSDPLSGRGWACAVRSAAAIAQRVQLFLRGEATSSDNGQIEAMDGFHRHVDRRASYWRAITSVGGQG